MKSYFIRPLHDWIGAGIALAILWLIVSIFSSCDIAHAETINIDKIVYAIGKAEGSTKYPYGIKSINTYGDIALSKQICENTVKNNLKRYKRTLKARETVKILDFLRFLGERYCPTKGKLTYQENALNRNWVKNVYYFYKKGVI